MDALKMISNASLKQEVPAFSVGDTVKVKVIAIKDGKLSLTTTDGQPLKLNPGRSWIGYASANNGGKVVEK